MPDGVLRDLAQPGVDAVEEAGTRAQLALAERVQWLACRL